MEALRETCLASSFTNGRVCEFLQNQSAGEMFQAIKQKLIREYVTK